MLSKQEKAPRKRNGQGSYVGGDLKSFKTESPLIGFIVGDPLKAVSCQNPSSLQPWLALRPLRLITRSLVLLLCLVILPSGSISHCPLCPLTFCLSSLPSPSMHW